MFIKNNIHKARPNKKPINNQPHNRFKTKLAISLTSCLAICQMQTASAACAISVNNNYEHIQNISLNSSTLMNGSTLQNGDILELTPGYSGYEYDENWSIWLDLNNDGDFSDNNELIFSSGVATNTTISANLVIPNNISGNNVDMRVVMHEGDISSDSCGFNSYGDYQDFNVNFGETDGGTGGGGTGDYALIQQPNGGADEHILSVEFGNDSYTSGNNNGYGDFSSNKTFTISNGDAISLTPVSSWTTNWAVWIDNDNNGSFDNDEQVFSGSGNRNNVVDGNLDLADISSGTARMRIAMNGNGSAVADGFRYGEIEDYSVNVQRDSGGSEPTDPGDKNYGSHVQWEHDTVHVKVFRFEFTDVDLTWSSNRIKSEMAEIQDYFDKESYGRFDVTYEIYDDVIQINERQSAWDNISSNDWKDYYADKLIALGESNYWNIDDNTIYLILSPQISDFGIKAGVNPGAIRVYDTGDERSQAGGIAHEMGHAMGLHHAQGLDGQDSVFGVGNYEAERIQYGNAFSMMGASAWEFGGFNLYYKNFFKAWDIKAEVPEVTQSGTYKIYALDHGSVRGDLGIRLKAGNGDVTYWVEYRTKDGADTDSVQINTEGYFPDEDSRSYYYGVSYLLDMTPNTHPDDLNDDFDDFDDFYDAGLVIGKSYTDKWGAFTVTPTRKGGTQGTASAWIEVKVDMH